MSEARSEPLFGGLYESVPSTGLQDQATAYAASQRDLDVIMADNEEEEEADGFVNIDAPPLSLPPPALLRLAPRDPRHAIGFLLADVRRWGVLHPFVSHKMGRKAEYVWGRSAHGVQGGAVSLRGA